MAACAFYSVVAQEYMHELGVDFAGTAVMSPSRSLFSLQGPHFAFPGTTPLSCFKLGADFARTDVASLTIFPWTMTV